MIENKYFSNDFFNTKDIKINNKVFPFNQMVNNKSEC